VDFPRIIARLKELNYGGAVTIEREISGHGNWKMFERERLSGKTDRINSHVHPYGGKITFFSSS